MPNGLRATTPRSLSPRWSTTPSGGRDHGTAAQRRPAPAGRQNGTLVILKVAVHGIAVGAGSRRQPPPGELNRVLIKRPVQRLGWSARRDSSTDLSGSICRGTLRRWSRRDPPLIHAAVVPELPGSLGRIDAGILPRTASLPTRCTNR